MRRILLVLFVITTLFSITANATTPKRKIPLTEGGKIRSLRAELRIVHQDLSTYLVQLDRNPSLESTSKIKKLRLLTTLRGIEQKAVQMNSILARKLLKDLQEVRYRVKKIDQTIRNKTLRAQLIAQSNRIRIPARPAPKHIETPSAGSISGTITDASNSSPLAFIEIDIYDINGSFANYGYTDASGNYNIPVNDGTYLVSTYNSDDYINELYDNVECNPYCDNTQGTPILVTGPVTGIDFGLLHSAQISGTVTDGATNDPLGSIAIFIFDSIGDLAAYGYTDATGNYTSDGPLSTGNYFAIATDYSQVRATELYQDFPCSNGCEPTSGTPIAVVTGSTTSGINFTLDTAGSISGSIMSATTSQPVFSGVYIYDSNGNVASFASTDANGSYEAGGLGPGTYFVVTGNYDAYIDELYDDISCPYGACNPQTGTPISVTVGSQVSGINFALQPGVVIRGNVTDVQTSNSIPDTYIDVYDSNGLFAGSTFSDENGAYSIRGLIPGAYFARTWNFSDYLDELYDNVPCDGFCDVFLGTPIQITLGGPDAIVNFQLLIGGSIEGKITNSVSGNPIGSVGVDIYNSSGDFVAHGYSDATGNYKAPGLSSGQYFVATTLYGPYTNEVYDNHQCPEFNCDPLVGDPVAVSAGASMTGIDFALDPAGSLSGLVTAAGTSAPVADFFIAAYDSQGFAVSYAFSNPDGTYTVEGLHTGNYFVVTSNFENYLDELYDNIPCFLGDCDPLSGTPVAVTTAQNTSGINFALDLGGTISGRVTDSATSSGVEFAVVEIYGTSGNLISYGYTDATGNYQSEYPGLPTGNFFASTFVFDGDLLNELYDNIPCSGFCDPLNGTPIPVITGADTGNIDFVLVSGGAISGKVMDAETSQPIPFAFIDVYDSAGNIVSYGYTDNYGDYTTYADLATGNYFVVATDYFGDYQVELYNDLPCPAGICDPTTGTPVPVVASSVTSGIDFAFGECATSTFNTDDLPDGTLGALYNQIIIVSGGPTPYQFSVLSGNLPTGLNLNQNSGGISGIPTLNGTFTFRIAAMDATGCTNTSTYAVNIATGTCLFCDDFEDAVVDPNWNYKGIWQETGGVLTITSQKKAYAIANPIFTGCTNCSVATDVQSTGGSGGRVSIFGWYQDRSNSVELLMKEQQNRWILKQRSSGQVVAKKKAIRNIDPGVNYSLSISFNGADFIVTVGGEVIITMPAGASPSGTVGYQIKGTTGSFGSISVN